MKLKDYAYLIMFVTALSLVLTLQNHFSSKKFFQLRILNNNTFNCQGTMMDQCVVVSLLVQQSLVVV